MNNRKKIIEYDVVRTYALIFVLLGHCTYNAIVTDYGGIDINVDESNACLMWKGLCFLTGIFYKFHMPLFVALSGCLWAMHVKGKGLPTFQSVWRNKTRRLLLPFLITALLWSIPLKYVSGYWDGAGEDTLRQMFVGQIFMFGNFNSHLWFVQALFWVFIMSYVVERYRLRRNTKTFLCVLTTLSIFGFYVRTKYHIELLNIITAFQYLLWFYVGFFFESRREKFNQYISHNVTWFWCVGGCTLYIVLVFAFGKIPHIPGFGTLSAYVLAPLGMALTYTVCYKSLAFTPPILLNIITNTSKNSYGLYLYSDPINYVILYLVNTYSMQWIYEDNFGSLSIYLVRFFATTFGAWVVIMITRKFNYKV